MVIDITVLEESGKLLATLNTTDSVTASTRVVIETRQPESTSFGHVSVDYDVLMSTASQVAISIPVAERAALALMDSLPVLAGEHLDFLQIDTPGGLSVSMRDIIQDNIESANKVYWSLNLRKGDTFKEAEVNYFRLIKIYNPERYPDEFKEIEAAYAFFKKERSEK